MANWEPKTKLGRLVKDGEVSTMAQAIDTGLPIRESEIVDILLPNLEDDVIDVNMVQRMTDSGRRVRFRVVAVVGNRDGFVGLGIGKGKEVGPTIRRTIDIAKLNVISVRRGSGSWESPKAGPPTSLPYKVTGRSGSVSVSLLPAPQGTGLATADVSKQVLSLAGVKDAWSVTKGQTRTTLNFAQATFDALKQTARFKIPGRLAEELNIVEGGVTQ